MCVQAVGVEAVQPVGQGAGIREAAAGGRSAYAPLFCSVCCRGHFDALPRWQATILPGMSAISLSPTRVRGCIGDGAVLTVALCGCCSRLHLGRHCCGAQVRVAICPTWSTLCAHPCALRFLSARFSFEYVVKAPNNESVWNYVVGYGVALSWLLCLPSLSRPASTVLATVQLDEREGVRQDRRCGGPGASSH